MSIPSRGTINGKVICQERAKHILGPERGLGWLEQRVQAVLRYESGERRKGRICRTLKDMCWSCFDSRSKEGLSVGREIEMPKETGVEARGEGWHYQVFLSKGHHGCIV